MLFNSKYCIWNDKDVLGSGATSTVYTGRSKDHGIKVAVKVFNSSSFMRSGEVQDREFEVLKKLKHRNVVQLIAIDVEERSRQRVIIMELCAKGSLFTMLDEPEHMFGVPEKEYKRILADICCGMKYLKQKEIVHRDLKPGNIMVLEDKKGQNIYKLADFGAARQLSNDENFVSLYGTEEYLHPDMYARALLSNGSRAGFNSTVDLWSLGVTLYHVATGSLPFRPYGGRNNKNTMHYLTTQKQSGVISGVQKNSMNGPVVWERELPKSTRMSIMFKSMLTPLLAGLLECDQTKMMSAEKFFEEVDKILDMLVFEVFDTVNAKMLKVYLHKDDTIDSMKGHIEKLSEIIVKDQLIIFHEQRFNTTELSSKFPNTSEKDPMILCTKTLQNLKTGSPLEPRIKPAYRPEFPHMSHNSHPDADLGYAKTSASVMFYSKHIMEETLCSQNAFKMAIPSVRSVIQEDLRQIDRRMADIDSIKVKVVTNLEALRKHLDFVHTLEDILKVQTNEEGQGSTSMKIPEIENLVKEIEKYHDQQITELNDVNVEAMEQENPFELGSLSCNSEDRCVQRFEVHLKSLYESIQFFKNNRRSKQREDLSILRLEKLQVRDLCEEAKHYQLKHCDTKLEEMFNKFTDYYKQSQMMACKIETYAEKVNWFKMKYSELQKNVEKVVEDLQRRQEILLSKSNQLRREEVKKESSSSTSSGSQPSLPSDFEVISSMLAATTPEETELSPTHRILPTFLQSKPKGRQITVKKDIKQEIMKSIPKENGDALSESLKLMKALEDESALFYSTLQLSTPPVDDLK